jgi:UDP-glucose 4-epimerase
MVIPRLVQQALHGEPLTVYGDGSQSRCFCNVADSVRAILGLADAPQALGQVFNIGSTEEVTILDLARRTIVLAHGSDLDWHKRITFIPYAEAYAAGFEDMQRRVPDTSKIREAIGWTTEVPLDETLRQVIAFYQETGSS